MYSGVSVTMTAGAFIIGSFLRPFDFGGVRTLEIDWKSLDPRM